MLDNTSSQNTSQIHPKSINPKSIPKFEGVSKNPNTLYTGGNLKCSPQIRWAI